MSVETVQVLNEKQKKNIVFTSPKKYFNLKINMER